MTVILGLLLSFVNNFLGDWTCQAHWMFTTLMLPHTNQKKIFCLGTVLSNTVFTFAVNNNTKEQSADIKMLKFYNSLCTIESLSF